MKHYLSTFAGSAICGGFAFGIWPELWKTYGLMGGSLVCCLIGGALAGIVVWKIRSCDCARKIN